MKKSFFNNPTFQNKPLDNPNYIPSFGDYSIFSRPNVNIPDSNVFLGVTGLQGIAQVGDNNIFNTFLDNENDANNLTNAEFDNPNKFKPNLADKVVLDNSIDKASNFKRVDGPDNYNALNSSSPTTTEGIYGGENTINSGIIKGNIFAVGASRQFNELFPNQNLSTLSEDSLAVKISSLKYDDQPDGGITNNFSVYNSGSLINNEQVLNRYNAAVMTQAQLNARGLTSKGNSTALYNPSDFRKTTNRGEFTDNASMLADLGTSTVLSLAPDYVRANQITKFNYGDPGQHKTSESEEINNVINYGVNANLLDALDKINALPIYAGSTVDNSLAVKDSCDFNIGIINNNNSGATNDYLHFRALIDNFSDNYTAKWDAVQYVGRGEELYNYKGFGREISMGWTVYAQSKAELIPMYKKLNYLASSLAPDYTGAGFMRGNIVKITVGGYIYDQPGIIKSISYGIPEESPWEIAIGVDGEEDTSVKQLPHMIKVTGFTFIPIHKFIPAKANSTTDPTQKYIALANQTGKTNYSDTYKNYSQQGAVRE